ncbi:MAG: NAD(P)-binding domain-containing protein [Actinobacteria bacterium]|nr:NAD(P)-binding domain-containing protein [Actinomycetota bacterium]
MPEHHDVVVIGGGQAGLAMSAVLQQHGREHVVLERRQVGERWRTKRWESLRFQFPNWSLELPGYAYSGDDPDGFAHWRDLVRVIEDYAVATRAPVREHTEVTALHGDDGEFVLSFPDGTMHARRVVVATGPFSGRASRSSPKTSRRRYCRPIRRATGARRSCRTAPCSSSVAGRPAARSPTNCCVLGVPFSCRFPSTGASPAAYAAGTSPGGWTGWAASHRRSTAFPDGSGRRRSSSPG